VNLNKLLHEYLLYSFIIRAKFDLTYNIISSNLQISFILDKNQKKTKN